MSTTWTVVYYMGGTQQGEWRRALPVPSQDAAQQMADAMRGGKTPDGATYNKTSILSAMEGL